MTPRLLTVLPALALVAAVAGCAPYVPSSRQLFDPFYLRDVQTDRLAGRWYETASFPAPFQKGCSHTTADYAPQADGTVGVVNRCRIGGKIWQIGGVAEKVGPGQLKVRLDGVPIAGDYWVLGLSRDGRTLLVGTPSRITGWVLHRDPRMSDEEIRATHEVFRRNGYDIASLQRTNQR